MSADSWLRSRIHIRDDMQILDSAQELKILDIKPALPWQKKRVHF